MPTRPALTVQRIVVAAVAVADRGGVAKVSMRNVGKELGVEAMSLYHHLAGKEELLDCLTDWIFTQIEPPEATRPWRAAMVDRSASARAALSRHPWALGLVESRRNPGPAQLRHHEAVLANLHHHRFSVALASHAISAIDSYVYGFVLTERNLPFDSEETVDDFVDEIRPSLTAEAYPRLVEMISVLVDGGEFRYADEFRFGLDLVLDGIERHLRRDRRSKPTGAASDTAPDHA